MAKSFEVMPLPRNMRYTIDRTCKKQGIIQENKNDMETHTYNQKEAL